MFTAKPERTGISANGNYINKQHELKNCNQRQGKTHEIFTQFFFCSAKQLPCYNVLAYIIVVIKTQPISDI